MSFYAVVSGKSEPVPLSELVFPVRIYFIVSDSSEGDTLNITLTAADISDGIQTKTFDLPFVVNFENRYFYSCIPSLIHGIGDTTETQTPTPTQTETKTPTPAPEASVDSQCISGITLDNNQISFGIELNDSPGQLIVDPKTYVPSPAIPIVVYIYINSVSDGNYCGKITINSRSGGIDDSTFNNTIFSYLHSDGICYNYDLQGTDGTDNFIVFGVDDQTDSLDTCCGGLEVLSLEDNSKSGIHLSDSEGFLCYDVKNYIYSVGIPTVVYIYLNDSNDSTNYRGKITLENRVGGLSLESFNLMEFVYIDSDDTCHKADFSDVNDVNIKIFNTYN